MLLETERLQVRRLTEADAEALFAVLSDPEVMRYVEPPFTLERTRTFLREAGLCEPPLVYAVLRKEAAPDPIPAGPEGPGQASALIGHLIWHPWGEDAMELGWILRRDCWGRGYARELTEALLRQTDLDVVIECAPEQAATRRLAEKLGFRPVTDGSGLAVYRRPGEKQTQEQEAAAMTDMPKPAPDRPAGELELYIPRPEDGWFYVKLLSDPATMAYNAPWFPPDGCIPDAAEEWKDLCAGWIGQEPKRFYAFLRRRSDGAFVGDVNFHYTPDRDWWDMGIVIYAPERGKGYGKQGLALLLDRAFRVAGISRLHNDFETTRDAAFRIHRAVGFREAGVEDGNVQLMLTREEYLRGGENGK